MSAHDLIYTFISSLIALFPVMNPIGNMFTVNGLISELDDVQRKMAVKKIFINCLFIGLGVLLAGHLILLLFGLAIPVIQLAGGIVICKTGWNLLSDSKEAKPQTEIHTVHKISIADVERKLFYPISFPMVIGAGSISVIFTLMASADDDKLIYSIINYSIIAMAIVVMCAFFCILLSQEHKIARRMGANGNLIINKLVAFLTFCIGIQIMLKGISKIFHINIL